MQHKALRLKTLKKIPPARRSFSEWMTGCGHQFRKVFGSLFRRGWRLSPDSGADASVGLHHDFLDFDKVGPRRRVDSISLLLETQMPYSRLTVLMVLPVLLVSTRLSSATVLQVDEVGPHGSQALPAIDALPVLRPGDIVTGVIEKSDPRIETAMLGCSNCSNCGASIVRGKTYRIELPDDGPYTIELRSYSFDAYLVLRNEAGKVLAEDNNGLIRLHSRLVISSPTASGGSLRLDACASHDKTGAFELRLLEGKPDPLTPLEKSAAELTDARKELRSVEHELGKTDPQTADRLYRLAGLLMDRGDYGGARSLLERALTIFETAFGHTHDDTVSCLGELALIHVHEGDYAAARPLLERVLAITERTFGTKHPHTAASLANLAVLLRAQGDHAAAKPLLERALAIAEATLGTTHPDTAVCLNNLAANLMTQGDYAAARPLCERALAIRETTLGKTHRDTAVCLNNLAMVLSALGDQAAARPLLERAVTITASTLGEMHPRTAEMLANLAALLHHQGDYAAARPLGERALKINETTFGTSHPCTVDSLHNLAAISLDTGQPGEALALSQRAMQGQQAHRTSVAWSLTESERLLFARTKRAIFHVFLSIPEPTLEAQQVESYEAVLAWKGQVLRSLTRSRGSVLASLEGADRRRVEQLQALQARLSGELFKKDIGDRAEYEAILASLREERNALEVELARSLGDRGTSPTPSAGLLRSALPDNAVLVDFLIHPVYRPAQFDSDGRRHAAGSWSAPRLSAWIVRPGTTSVLRIDLGDAARIEAATRAFLDELIARRGVMPIGNDRPVADADAPTNANERLRKMLWDPLQKELGNAALVFVSPDGFLGTLPFETLQDQDGAYLLEHHAFVYGEDATWLVDSAASKRSSAKGDASRFEAASTDLLCVGNINYRRRGSLAWRDPSSNLPDDGPGRSEPSAVVAAAATPTSSLHALARGGFPRRWTALPATDEEARAISEIHEETYEASSSRLTLLGGEATEERLKHELPRHDILHLATHGFFQPDGLPSMWRQVRDDDGTRRMKMFEEEERVVGLMPGLMSGLVLAGANRKPGDDRDDGFLTAEEISFLDLSGVQLVVLSACETALGRSETGEGMLGLRRTFRQSGARTVISSLWKVSDEATSQLMQGFYERLWLDGASTLAALRGAQLDMLKQNRIENDGAGLPSTWGAFVLDGAWQ